MSQLHRRRMPLTTQGNQGLMPKKVLIRLRLLEEIEESLDEAYSGQLGLPAPFAGAASELVQPRFQVLDEGGVGALADALQFVRIGFEVIELVLPGAVLLAAGGGEERRDL